MLFIENNNIEHNVLKNIIFRKKTVAKCTTVVCSKML